MCDMYQLQVSQFNFIGKKTKKNKTSFDDEDYYDEQHSYTTRQSSTDTIQSMLDKKKVSWIDNDVEEIIDYNPNEAVISCNDTRLSKE